MTIPKKERLNLTAGELRTLGRALEILRIAIAARPTNPTPSQNAEIDKACDARNALESIITMETGVKP